MYMTTFKNCTFFESCVMVYMIFERGEYSPTQLQFESLLICIQLVSVCTTNDIGECMWLLLVKCTFLNNKNEAMRWVCFFFWFAIALTLSSCGTKSCVCCVSSGLIWHTLIWLELSKKNFCRWWKERIVNWESNIIAAKPVKNTHVWLVQIV